MVLCHAYYTPKTIKKAGFVVRIMLDEYTRYMWVHNDESNTKYKGAINLSLLIKLHLSLSKVQTHEGSKRLIAYLDNIRTSVAICFLHFSSYFKWIFRWNMLSSFLHETLSKLEHHEKKKHRYPFTTMMQNGKVFILAGSCKRIQCM